MTAKPFDHRRAYLALQKIAKLNRASKDSRVGPDLRVEAARCSDNLTKLYTGLFYQHFTGERWDVRKANVSAMTESGTPPRGHRLHGAPSHPIADTEAELYSS